MAASTAARSTIAKRVQGSSSGPRLFTGAPTLTTTAGVCRHVQSVLNVPHIRGSIQMPLQIQSLWSNQPDTPAPSKAQRMRPPMPKMHEHASLSSTHAHTRRAHMPCRVWRCWSTLAWLMCNGNGLSHKSTDQHGHDATARPGLNKCTCHMRMSACVRACTPAFGVWGARALLNEVHAGMGSMAQPLKHTHGLPPSAVKMRPQGPPPAAVILPKRAPAWHSRGHGPHPTHKE